jgi:hypothetical protein
MLGITATASAATYNVGYRATGDADKVGIVVCEVLAGNDVIRDQLDTDTNADSVLEISDSYTLANAGDNLVTVHNGTNLTCDAGDSGSTTLTAFTFSGGVVLTLTGNTGVDTMEGTSAGLVDFNGSTGNDIIRIRSAGVAHGDGGNDNVVSDLGGAGGESLLGDAGEDCLRRIVEAPNDASAFNCGADDDEFNDDATFSEISCSDGGSRTSTTASCGF